MDTSQRTKSYHGAVGQSDEDTNWQHASYNNGIEHNGAMSHMQRVTTQQPTSQNTQGSSDERNTEHRVTFLNVL